MPTYSPSELQALIKLKACESDYQRGLREGIKQGLLRAAEICENGRFLHDDAPDARFGKACAEAILAEAEKEGK